MLVLLPLIALSALGPVVHGWSMDVSCAPAMKVAFKRAKQASEQITKSPRDVHVDALVKTLFSSDSAKIQDAADRLKLIQWLEPFWVGRTGPYDVHVYCSTARISDFKKKGVKVGYNDPDRGDITGGALMDNCRGISQGDTKTRALLTNAGGPFNSKGQPTTEIRADTLQLCEWYLATLAVNGFALTDTLVKQAADVKSKGIVGKFIARSTGGETAAPVDSIYDFASVLLHEMTHSAVARYSDDTPNGKCYGWKNSAKCQLSKNADSLAYFALGVDLILNARDEKRYTINKDGTLQELV